VWVLHMGKFKKILKRSRTSVYVFSVFFFLFVLTVILKYFTKGWFFSWINEFTPPVTLTLMVILLINMLVKKNLLLKISIHVVDFFKQVLVVVFGFVTVTYFYEFFRAYEDFYQDLFGSILIKFIIIALFFYLLFSITKVALDSEE